MCLDREKDGPPQQLRHGYQTQAGSQPRSGFDGQADGAMVGRAFSRAEILQRLFTYQAPNSETIPKYKAINQAAKNFAEIVLEVCPDGPTARAAVDLIIDAKMKANAAIALNGLSL